MKGSPMASFYPSHLLADERQIIAAILAEAMGRRGLLASVFDGEEWAVTGTNNRFDVEREVAATDETTLRFRDPARLDGRGNPALVGSVYLVHGNGSDVIADHTDSREVAEILAPAFRVAETLSVRG